MKRDIPYIGFAVIVICATIAVSAIADRPGLVYRGNGGALLGVGSGALLSVESGGELDVNDGATLDVNEIPQFSSFVAGTVSAGASTDTQTVSGADASTRWVASLADTAMASYIEATSTGFVFHTSGNVGTDAAYCAFGADN